MNFTKFLRIPCLQNTSGELLLQNAHLSLFKGCEIWLNLSEKLMNKGEDIFGKVSRRSAYKRKREKITIIDI